MLGVDELGVLMDPVTVDECLILPGYPISYVFFTGVIWGHILKGHPS